MPKHRLFCPGLEMGPNTLSEAESHHAIAALRLKKGDRAELFNGQGQTGTGMITAASNKNLSLEVSSALMTCAPPTARLTLAVAMPRSHRQGYLVEKCSELGVSAIWPLSTDRSVAKPGHGAIDKWKRRAVQACKQSGNNWLPSIEPVLTFADVLTKLKAFDVALMADSYTNQDVGERLSSHLNCTNLLVLIGPEGGWSDSEREQAICAEVSPVAFAPFTLRTETAAIAACCVVARRGMSSYD